MVTLRRAYEKRGLVAGGRRGRVEGVPLGVYYDIDEAFRQIKALAAIQGADRAALAAALRPSIPSGGKPADPGQPNPEATHWIDFTAFLDYSGSAGASSSSTLVTLFVPFRILGISITIESSSGSGTVSARPFVHVAGQEKGTSAFNQAKTFAHLVATNFSGLSIEGQQSGGIVEFSPGTVQLKHTNASPTARISGTIQMKVKVPITVNSL